MKINFKLTTDGKRHRYCQNCLSEKVRDVDIKGKRYYQCDDCRRKYERLIDIDPALKWWVDEKTKEYWHESVGIFLKRPDKKLLFFERTIFPYGHTIPAGHLEIGEEPDEAVLRELLEETGIKIKKAKLFKTEGVAGDKCRRGADYHLWNLYTAQLDNQLRIKVDKREGRSPVWLGLAQALKKELTLPVRYFLEKYGKEIVSA